MSGRAIISFDLDGVLAEPPFGWNPAINRNVSLQPQGTDRPPDQLSPPQTDTLTDHLLRATWYRLRYVLRPPREGALECVRAAAAQHDVIVLTGRHERGRRSTSSWLQRHGFAPHLSDLIMNGSPLSSARYKESTLRYLDAPIALHADDDAATVALLARNGIPAALLEWPRNRDLDYPDGVARFADMRELLAAMRELS